jgi:hypothetical protein
VEAEVYGKAKHFNVVGGAPGWFRPILLGLAGSREPNWEWYSCRERFHNNHFPNGEQFLYGVSSGKGVDVARFMWKVEKRLGLEERSEFAATQRSDVIFVLPCDWWRKHGEMRMQFFSIAIRAALEAKPTDTALAGLKRHPYFRRTWPAVRRFMDGHTKFRTRNVSGWVRDFRVSPRLAKKGITLKSLAESSLNLPERVRKYRPKRAA